MTHIPQSDILSTTNLSRVFNSTTATYKFYWFQSLLQMHNEEGAYRMNVWDLVIRMVVNAWFPIHYFRLSFGSMDSLHKIVTELQWITALPMDARKEDIIAIGQGTVRTVPCPFKPDGWKKGAPIFMAFTGDVEQLEAIE